MALVKHAKDPTRKNVKKVEDDKTEAEKEAEELAAKEAGKKSSKKGKGAK